MATRRADRRQDIQNYPKLRRFVIANVRRTGQELGVGSYGSVEELDVDGRICAGKSIHETLIERGNFGLENIAQRFVEECQLMSDLTHPHLVEFMGVCFLPDSSLPVLVMERLLMSLDDLLENTPDVPLALKRSILADVCKGLMYLHNHSPPVIHRDLSSKNVLLDSDMVAKISDLGNSRIVDFRPGQLARTLSRIPGTMVYMPPEAFADRSRYGTSLDIFSFGHLALFTITQVFPGDLKSSTYPDPNDPDNLIARSEVGRREDYIDQLHQQLGEGHPLVRMIKQCLHNAPSRRPSTEEVLQQLEGLRDQIPHTYDHLTRMIEALKQKDCSVQQLSSQLQHLQLEMDGAVGQLQEKETQLHQMESQMNAVQQESRDIQTQLQRVQAQLTAKDELITSMQGELRNLQSQLDRKQAEASQKDSLLVTMRADLETRGDQLREKERENGEKDTEIGRLLGELRNLQSQLERAQSGNSAKDRVVTDLQAQIHHEDTEISGLQLHQVIATPVEATSAPKLHEIVEELQTFHGGSVVSSRRSSFSEEVPSDAPTRDDEEALKFAADLTANRTAPSREFVSATISDRAAAALGDGLSNNRSLRELKLANCTISSVGVAALASALSSNTFLKTLWFVSATISDRAAAALGDGLSNNHSLRKLELANCRISSVGVAALATALSSNTFLKTLCLKNCGITDDSMVELSQALLQNTTLEELDLGNPHFGGNNNKITHLGASSLSKALLSNKSLKTLNLRWNELADQGICSIAEALHGNETLQSLDLGGNNVSDQGATALAKLLETNGSIKTLDLTWNKIADQGVCAITDALHGNQTLQNLNLSLNNITDVGILALSAMLPLNKSLQHLELSLEWPGHYVTDEGVRQLASGLEGSTSLKTLKLYSTSHISHETMKILRDSAQRRGIVLNY